MFSWVLGYSVVVNLETLNLSNVGGLEPQVDGVWERASLSCCVVDGEMANHTSRHIHIIQLEPSVNLEAFRAKALHSHPNI